jgi:DNA-directed RNA polymerase sigma subunit (sigma70/sigma32)
MLIDCIVSLFSCDYNLYIYTYLREEYTENIHSNISTIRISTKSIYEIISNLYSDQCDCSHI